MAGLLQAAPAQQPEASQPAQPQGNPQQEQQKPRQAFYQRLITMALQFLYSDQGVQAVKQGLQMPGTPPENIGVIVGRLTQKMIMDVKEQGKQLPPLMVIKATLELAQAVTDMALEAGLVPKEQANETAKQAFYEAMTTAGQGTQKVMQQDERQQYQSVIQTLDQADQAAQQKRQGAA